MALIETLKDRFDDNSLDAALWGTYTNLGGTIAETGSKITFTPQASTAGSAAEISSNSTYDLASSSIYINLFEGAGPSTDNYLRLYKDASNNIAFFWASGNLTAYSLVATVETYGSSAAITPGISVWLRLRETAGTTYWEYSTNNQSSWTTLQSAATSTLFTMTGLAVLIGIYEYGTPATPGVSRFDSLNYFHMELSLSDSVTISESVSVETSTLTNTIDISDSILIEEGYQPAVDGGSIIVDTADVVTIEDVVWVFVDVNDNVLIEENINVDVTFTTSASESVSITESVGTFLTVYLQDVFDSVSISENTDFYFRLYGTVVQTKALNAGESVNQVVFSMDSNYTAGNAVIVFAAGEYDQTVTSVTDDAGNTYTLIEQGATVGDYAYGSMWCAKNVSVGVSPPEITVTYSGAVDATIIVREYKNLHSDPYDVSAIAIEGASTNSHTVGATSTTTEAYDTIVAAYAGSANSAYVVGTGYGNLATINGFDVFRSAAMEDKNVYVVGGQTATITSATFSTGVFIIAAFKSATGDVNVNDSVTISESVTVNVNGFDYTVNMADFVSVSESFTVYRVPIYLPVDVYDTVSIIDLPDLEPLDPVYQDAYPRSTKFAGGVATGVENSLYGGVVKKRMNMKIGGSL